MNKKFLNLLVCASLFLALFGYGLAQDDEPQEGGTLTWAYIQKPRSLDPNVWTGGSDNDVMRQIFDPLIWSVAPGEFIPGLAESWEVSEDALVYTFNLRQDVTFHDGSPFNAESVKFTFDRIVDPETRSLQAGNLGPYDRTEVIDEYTVAVYFTEPFAPFLTNISSTSLSPASPTAVERLGEDYALSPVGTGPFMFDQWEGNDLHLVRNPDYNWAPAMMSNQGQAYLDRIIVREVREPATRMVTLRTGEANYTHYPVFEDLESFQADGFNIHQAPRPGFTKSMPINMDRAPTDDLRVRQAINYGIDKELVVDIVISGWGMPAYGPLKRGTFGYDPMVEEYYNYDPDLAASLLEEAGWVDSDGDGIRDKDGQNLTVDLIMFDSGINASMAEFIQALLFEMGFEANLDITAYDAFAQRVNETTYNLAEMNWASSDPNLVLFNMFHSSQAGAGGQFNRTRIQSDAMDSLIEGARSALTPEVREDILAEIQEYAVENALILPLWDSDWVLMSAPEVRGQAFDPEGRPLFHNFWILNE